VRAKTQGDAFEAFVPAPLPPQPPVKYEPAALARAENAVRRLDALTSLVPSTAQFVYSFVRKEALISSQIEGTQSSYADLLLFETKQAPGVPVDDVREVSDYVAALEQGGGALAKGSAVSVALLRRLHATLLRGPKGKVRSPGQFRRRQVWIGGDRPSHARFVPPPAALVPGCMQALDRFLRGSSLPPLVTMALAHVQLETIHPFRDGNGRIGRLMISLMLMSLGLMREPLLYVSTQLKARRREYYDRLQAVRFEGDWEGWVRFFLEAVTVAAGDAVSTARELLTTAAAHRAVLAGSPSAHQVLAALERRPIADVRWLAAEAELTFPTVAAALSKMQRAGLVGELTGRRRNRLFAYAPYIAVLSRGAEPLRR
jgi:Fic family protein